MKNVLIITFCLLAAVARAQSEKDVIPGLTKPTKDTVQEEDAVKQVPEENANAKYEELQKELKRVKEEQKRQLLKSYAKEWQRNRAAEAPHILARKLQIEKEALADGITVDDMKNFLKAEKLAKKAAKK